MAGMLEKQKFAEVGFVEMPGVKAPAGIYALFWKGELVYIGQTKNAFRRIATHVNGYKKKNYITKDYFTPGDVRGKEIKFDRCLVRFCAVSELHRLETQLIYKYKPKYNTIVRSPLPDHVIDIVKLAEEAGLVRWKDIWAQPEPMKRRRMAA